LAKRLGNRPGKGIFVANGKDRFNKSLSLFDGDTFYCKVSTADTDGGLYVIETTRDKKGGPPLHLHPDQDEWWYVLEGEFLVKIGDELFTAKPGDSVFGPKGIPHAFAKVNEGPAKVMVLFQPAGMMEEHFKGISEGVTKNMTDEQRKKYSKDHGINIVGPALTYLKM